MIVFLLFFVLGPFGLPLVYKSPRFNQFEKSLLTVLTLIYTWYVVLLTTKFFHQVLEHFDALRLLLES